MPTTIMAVSSPLNPTSTVISQDDISAIISPQLTQNTHESEMAQFASDLNGTSESDDIIKATVNGSNNMKNGATSKLLTGEQGSPKVALHSPITIGTVLSNDIDLNIKANDMNCLNVITSSPTLLGNPNNINNFMNGTNGNLLMAQSSASLNFQEASNSPDTSPWSIGEENSSSSGFVNYSSPNNGHMHKRPMSHGLSPNSRIGQPNASQQQQYIHYNKNNGNNGSSNYSAWNQHSGQSSMWNQQQQHQQQHQQMQLLHQSSSQASMPWNRGRSVPNLQPMSSPHVPQHHQRKHQNHSQYPIPSNASSSHQNPNSPSKYRRSTSYPGKNQNMHVGYQMDVSAITEDQSYMSYQVRFEVDINYRDT